MKRWGSVLLAVCLTVLLLIPASAEATQVLELDFSDPSCVQRDEIAMKNYKGEMKIEDDVLKLSGWTAGTTTAANYIKTAGILPEAYSQMGTLTLELELTPQDISWICIGIVIGDKANGTEQDAVVVGVTGNDFTLEKRGQIQLNMGGVVTELGTFNTGELMADMTYIMRIYKDNEAGTVEMYFYEKDGKVPSKPTLTVQSDIIKTIQGNISFTAYAGRYSIDNVRVWDGETPRPTNPPTTTRVITTTEAPTVTTSSKGNTTGEKSSATGKTTSTASDTATDAEEEDSRSAVWIVLLCIAGAAVIGAAVTVTLLYRSSQKKKKDDTPNAGE